MRGGASSIKLVHRVDIVRTTFEKSRRANIINLVRQPKFRPKTTTPMIKHHAFLVTLSL